jgi:hypothetical protein
MAVSPQALFAYALIAWLAAATPGPAVLLALRNGATRGFRAGLFSTLGNLIGLGPVHTIFSRCVADQKGHAQGAKRSRGLPPARLCNAAHGLFGRNPKGTGWKQRHSSLHS